MNPAQKISGRIFRRDQLIKNIRGELILLAYYERRENNTFRNFCNKEICLEFKLQFAERRAARSFAGTLKREL